MCHQPPRSFDKEEQRAIPTDWGHSPVKLNHRCGQIIAEDAKVILTAWNGESILATPDDSQREYLLAAGEAAADRLLLLHEIFGPSTKELLRRAGISEGMRVAEIGCGTGLTTLWIAERVGRRGAVTALDASGEQLRIAEKNAAAAGVRNLSFAQGDAYDTGLARESFDLIFSRFLMCHLTEPPRALAEMRSLLKPGGILVCEDHDDGGIFTEPPTQAYKRLTEISQAVNQAHGFDSFIGLKLPLLLIRNGFSTPRVRVNQIALLQGRPKRFWEITLREAAPAILAAKASTADELESICTEMQAIASDNSILLMLARVTQVWARK